MLPVCLTLSGGGAALLILNILGGIVLLAFGGEFLVRGTVALGHRFGVSAMLISLTVVGFGTSTPELVTSVQAALAGSPDIAIGNVVGSNIANLLLALGAAAVIAPIIVHSRALRRDGSLLVLSATAFAALSALAPLTLPIGLLLLSGLVGYVAIAYAGERRLGRSAAASMGEAIGERLPPTLPEPRRGSLVMAAATAALGLTSVLGGAGLLVDGALGVARAFAVPEAVIGLSLVAVGTSLPEVFTSAFAAWRKQPEVAFGNAIGSCIYNVLGIAGTTAVIVPLEVPVRVVVVDNPVMIAASLAVVLFALTGNRIGRREGLLLLAGYVTYVLWLYSA